MWGNPFVFDEAGAARLRELDELIRIEGVADAEAGRRHPPTGPDRVPYGSRHEEHRQMMLARNTPARRAADAARKRWGTRRQRYGHNGLSTEDRSRFQAGAKAGWQNRNSQQQQS